MPDVILRRLHQVDELKFLEVLEYLNEFLLRNIVLPEDPLIAVDFKTLPYHGKEQPSLVSDSRLLGTNLGIRFAVLSVVEKEKTFTLRVKQVDPVKDQDGTAKVNLVFTERETKKGTVIHPFITSLDMGPEKISKLFGWRWRIETNNREF